MSKEGFYSITYQGADGLGFGMLALETGTIAGADIMGGRYDGRYVYSPRTDQLECEVEMAIPANVPLVTGSIEFTERQETLHFSLPRQIEESATVTVNLQSGPVLVKFQKIRDFPN